MQEGSIMENATVATEVLQRLKQALQLDTDTQLAGELGLSTQALNKRKLRGSLPTEEIDTVIETHGLSAAWVYSGKGPMFEGGQAEAARIEEFRELVDQLRAMKLRDNTRDAVERVLRGVVWGDPVAVEAVIEQLSALNVTERDLVARYRHADAELKGAIERLLLGKSPVTERSFKQTFHGEVSQVISGETIQGGISISMGKKKARA